MQQRPLTYVSRITNLSDARYCAGMGVDLLGFVIDPTDPNYVSPASFQEMIGWVSGPGRVIEVRKPGADIHTLREQYSPDFLHIPYQLLPEFGGSPVKLIVELPYGQLGSLQEINQDQVAYWMVTGAPDAAMALRQTIPVLIARHAFPGSVSDYLQATGARGIVLSGTREVAPGLKDYDHLSQVLEELYG